MTWKFPDSRILIFCKAPIPGKVKTRLTDLLNNDQACFVHQFLSHYTIRLAVESQLAPVIVYAGLDVDHVFFKNLHADINADVQSGFEIRPQAGENLGQKMQNAFNEVFDVGKGIQSTILIGSDCPIMESKHLDVALKMLHSKESVIVPMEDGGYGLIGFKNLTANTRKNVFQACFKDINWGRADVLEKTLKQLKNVQLDPILLDTLWDVDVMADLERCLALTAFRGLARGLSKPSSACHNSSGEH